ncbi:MAG: hypothetical protein A2Z16_02005 [Chloroflexi bacterium RBG_16_54_18]|nr:MAG: hypothetical protein A2Z16_02005 [Chloroflexi bacterium RBG_16_54_18]
MTKQSLPFWTIGFIIVLAACSNGSSRLPATRTSTTGQVSQTPGTPLPVSQTPSQPAHTPTLQETLDLTDEDLRGTVIHFWHAWSGESGKVIRQLVDEFNLSNRWGIVVVPVMHSSYDELNAELDISLAQRSPPDLVAAFLHQALSWNLVGGLVELDRYVDDPTWGMSVSEQEDFYPVFWEQDLLAGKLLGIPAQRSGQMLYYNRSWAEELGFNSEPSNTEAFADQACASLEAVRADEDPANNNLGGWIIAEGDRPDYSALLGWIASFGGKIFQPPATTISTRSPYRFDNPQVEDAFTFMRGLYDDGCARFATASYPQAEFAARGGLFSTGSIMGIPSQKVAFTQASSQDEWTVIPFPSPGSQPAVSVYGPSFQILPSSPEQQLAAWVFTKWILSPENQARLVQETSAFPLRRSVLEHLATYRRLNPHWAAAVDLLSSARAEPALQSWDTVRWALSDASTQLFRSYFTIDQVPNLLALLDRTAAELHLGPDLDEVFATPVPATLTPTP